ncbi:ribosome maturation factor RimP [soil metagenome]
MAEQALERAVEERLQEAGYEPVVWERAGTPRRPVLRLRIDHLDAAADAVVTVDDCAAVHRLLTPLLDARADLSSEYVLEVSSPGVERPLVRTRDWERFAGREVEVRSTKPGAGTAAGTLLGLDSSGGSARLRLADGDEVEVPLEEVSRANLRFRWDKARRPGNK